MNPSALEGEEYAVLRGFMEEQLGGHFEAPKTLIQKVFLRLAESRHDTTEEGGEERRVRSMADDFGSDDRQIRNAQKRIDTLADEYFGENGGGRRWRIRFCLPHKTAGRPSKSDVPQINRFEFRANAIRGWAMRKFLAPLLPTDRGGEQALLVQSETQQMFDLDSREFVWLSGVHRPEDLDRDGESPLRRALQAMWKAGRLQFRERPGFETETALGAAIGDMLADSGVSVETAPGTRLYKRPDQEQRHVVLFGNARSNPAMAQLSLPPSLAINRHADEVVEGRGWLYEVHIRVSRYQPFDGVTITAIEADHPAGYAALHGLLEDNDRFQALCDQLRVEPMDALPLEFQFGFSVLVNDRHETVGRGNVDLDGSRGFPTAKQAAERKSVRPAVPRRDPDEEKRLAAGGIVH
jgi:hypothetical protein